MIREITNIKKDVTWLLDLYDSSGDKYDLDYKIMSHNKSLTTDYDKEFNYQFKKRYNKTFNPKEFSRLLDLEKMTDEEIKLLRLQIELEDKLEYE